MVTEHQKIQLLKAEEIASMLGLKVQTVYTMARRGELEKVKLSRRCIRFRAGEVERFIERKRVAICRVNNKSAEYSRASVSSTIELASDSIVTARWPTHKP